MAWTKEIPKEEGWYWIKYRNGRSMTKCPCLVMHLQDKTVYVHTARNVIYMAGPHHGGPELKVGGAEVDKSVRFGPVIEVPE